jgi:hypothetical protein
VDEQLQLLERQLRDFRNDPTALVIEYPATLSNKQRQRLHVVAEKLNLQHVSHGEEGNRVLVVSKPTTTRPKSAAASTPTTPAPAMVPDSNGYMRQEDSGYQRAKRVNAYVYRTTRPPRLTNSTHMRTHAHIHTHMRTYIHTCAHTYIHTYIHTYTDICKWYWVCRASEIRPIREPSGPDGSRGFSTDYQASRSIQVPQLVLLLNANVHIIN